MDNNEWITKETENIILDDSNYVVNLEWRNKQTSSGTAPRITRSLAKENIPHDDIDIYFPYIGSDKMYAQIGYGINNNIPKGAKSLAISLLSAKEGKWIGLFKVNKKQSYLIFINDDLIDPDGDILIEHEIAEEKFKEICETNELTRDQIVMHIDNKKDGISGLLKILEEANSKKIPSYKTIEVNLKAIHPIFYLLPLGIVLGGLGYGYIQYQANVERLEIEAQRQREEVQRFREQELLNSQNKENEYRELLSYLEEKKQERYEEIFENAKRQKPKPWFNEPNPYELFSFCLEELKKMPLFKSTWRLQNASCNRNEVRGIYRRGDVVNVDRFIEENPTAFLDIIGESATFRYPVVENFNRSDDRIPENFQEYRDSRYRLIGSLQNRNVSYNLGGSSFASMQIEGTSWDEDDGIQVDDYDLSSIGTSIFDQIRNSRATSNRNTRVQESVREKSYRERYEEHLKEDEIERLTLSDLPDHYIDQLNDIYEIDWATQHLTISTQNTLDWFGNVIPNIKGLRVNEIIVDIGQSSLIEWRLIGTFYYKERASIGEE